MGKPSIFSKGYDERMKRRRINITLFILILVFAGFFGARYYINEHNINISLKMPWLSEIFKDKDSEKKDADKKNNNTSANNNTGKNNTAQPTQPADKVETKFYEYKNAAGKVIKILYNQSSLGNEITGIQSDNEVITSDIFTDKKKIVFEDKSNGSIILTDNTGVSKIISPDSYKSKSSGIVIKKDTILKNNTSYVWAQKPHFTSDGKVVFISQLPYIKGNDLYMWLIRDDGSIKMVGKLNSTDIQKISYSGFDEKGALKININGDMYYFSPGEYKIKK
jgi:hypothetical protein